MPPEISNIPIRDIHLPDPVSWWPLAMGWWILLFIIVMTLVAFGWYLQRRKLFQVKKQALVELNQLHQQFLQQQDSRRFVKELSILLRRVCISQFPQEEVAGLIGHQWLKYLDNSLSAKKNKSGYKYSDGIGLALINVPYSKKVSNLIVDVNALYILSSEWINSLGPTTKNAQRRKYHSNDKGQVHASI